MPQKFVWIFVQALVFATIVFAQNFAQASADCGNLSEAACARVESWLTHEVKYHECEAYPNLPEGFAATIKIGLSNLKTVNLDLTDKIIKTRLSRKITVSCKETGEGVAGDYRPQILFIDRRIRIGSVLADAYNGRLTDINDQSAAFHEFLHYAGVSIISKHNNRKHLHTRLDDGRFQLEVDGVYACAFSAFPARYYFLNTVGAEWDRALYSMNWTCKNAKLN